MIFFILNRKISMENTKFNQKLGRCSVLVLPYIRWFLPTEEEKLVCSNKAQKFERKVIYF